MDQLPDQIRQYYTAYYRMLGLPNWPSYVEQRVVDEEQEAERLRHFESLAGPMRGKRVLNIGCGTGGMNIIAARWGAIVNGIDPDAEALDICHQKARREGFSASHLWFDRRVAEALPYENGYFDIVYSFSAIEHVRDVERAMREMIRITKPGGLIYLHGPNSWRLYEGHFKVFWLPFFWWGWLRHLGAWYLRWRKGRAGAAYIHTLNWITFRRLTRALAGESVAVYRVPHLHRRNPGLLGWFDHLYMRAFRIDPHVEILIFKVGGDKNGD